MGTPLSEAELRQKYEVDGRLSWKTSCIFISQKKMERPDVVLGLEGFFTVFRRVSSSQLQFTVVVLFEYNVEEGDRVIVTQEIIRGN